MLVWSGLVNSTAPMLIHLMKDSCQVFDPSDYNVACSRTRLYQIKNNNNNNKRQQQKNYNSNTKEQLG